MGKRIKRRNLPLLLLQAREHILSQFRPLLSEYGLTEQQWRVMRLLDETGPLEPRDISQACAILKPSLTGVLGRMEEVKLVARRKHASDQRRQIVALTPIAENLIAKIAPAINKQYDLIEAKLGRDLMKSLFNVLDGILAIDIDSQGAGANEVAAE